MCKEGSSQMRSHSLSGLVLNLTCIPASPNWWGHLGVFRGGHWDPFILSWQHVTPGPWHRPPGNSEPPLGDEAGPHACLGQSRFISMASLGIPRNSFTHSARGRGRLSPASHSSMHVGHFFPLLLGKTWPCVCVSNLCL